MGSQPTMVLLASLLAVALLLPVQGSPGIKDTKDSGNSTDPSCPAHWIDASMGNMGCLLFDREDAFSWEESQAFCQSLGASLIEIYTEEQFAFVRSELIYLQDQRIDKNWWIGATDADHEAMWYWASSYAHVGTFLWHSGEPNNGEDGNCMHLWNAYQEFLGADAHCGYPYSPICQIK